MAITILGLGPGPIGLLTMEAHERLQAAAEVYVRTARHPTVAQLPPHLAVHSFDDLYDNAPTFDAVYQAIVDRVLELGQRPQGVLYAVPGHPLMAEATVAGLLAAAPGAGIEVEVVAGLSFVEPALAALGLDPLTPGEGIPSGLQLADALALRIDPARPALIAQVYNRTVAAQLKLDLLELYPPEHPVTLISGAGTAQRTVQQMPLVELDRGVAVDHLSCLYVPPAALTANVATFDGLAAIVARLRAPEGCPWDRAQTHISLKPYLLEETYEALAALDDEDMGGLQEELGDLLLNILLQCQIAAEEGEFEVSDVVRTIAEKLIRRHPHVFGDATAATPEEVVGNWEALKRQERPREKSMLDGIAPALPALAHTRSVQERIAPLHLPIEDGLMAEAKSLVEWLTGGAKEESLAALGTALLSLAYQASAAGLDPEEALRRANRALGERIRTLERLALDRGEAVAALSPEDRTRLWQAAVRADEGN
ncbi:MAG: nucleoside triphosphate pyrophosphohydrolase [Dehalococcoidia bacterium]|nr:nucleoside triphosphate pyrophosphohydrolase [Dehalococcoidia bacterium]